MSDKKSGPHPRILVVEDDQRMRQVLEMLLSDRFAVETAPTAGAALESIKQHVPDLTLLDLLLPDQDGFDVLAQLNADARTRRIPVIVISGVSEEDARVRALQAGAVDFLVKPFSERELLLRMDAQLETAAREAGADDARAASVEARLALRKSEERFEAYVALASEGIWCFELDEPIPAAAPAADQVRWILERGWLSECNDATARLYGYAAASELVGARLPALLSADDPANADVLGAFVASGYRLVDAESRAQDREGRPRVLLNNLVGIVEDGQLVRAWGTQRDVTDRKRAEDLARQQQARVRASEGLLRTVIEGLEDAIFLKDRQGRYLMINSAGARVAGLTPADMTGADDAAVFPAEVAEQLVRGDQRVMQTRTTESFELAIGEGRVYLSTKAPYLDDDGHVVGVIGIARDITERKHAEEERERLLSEAEAANRTKDEFLATLSHELRTPLNAVVGWVHMLKAGGLDQEQSARAVDVIDRNARSLTQLIADLLDLSRIAEGKVRLQVRQVDLASVVQGALDTVQHAALARGIRIQPVVDEGQGLVSGDPERLQQVVWNLLTNAVKFTPRGGRVQVRVERVDSHVELLVEDTGIGIDPDFLPYVFDRFRQADGSRTRRHGGLGLGLAIVRHLVELHGGTVHAESRGRDQGASFVVRLPLLSVSRPASAVDAGAGTAALTVEALAGKRVLVVDDDADARLVVSTVLEQHGAGVIAAASAAEGFELLRREKPDVLISDIGMTGEDGYALVMRVRGLPPEEGGLVPAAALTAFGHREDRMRALMAGFQMHLTKPVNPAELVAAVASLAAGAVTAGGA